MSKRIVLFVIAVLLLTPILFQLSTYSASAEKPVTAPATFFNLVGKVTYKQLGRLMHNTERITPAEGVKVSVKGFFDTSKKYETTTDAQGMYTIQVPSGMYSVEVNEHASYKADFFAPPFQIEKVKEGKTSRADFQGLVFPHH